MRYLIIVALCLSLGSSSENPSWFYTLKLKKNQIIGYGEASKLSSAKAIAKNEIASVITTKIKSSLKIRKSLDENGIKRKIDSSIDVSTDIQIDKVNIIKSVYLNKKWYVAASYDYSPFAIKFKKLLVNHKLKDQKQNDFLSHTNLIKNLNMVIGKKLNYKLYSQNDIWYISYDDINLQLGQKDFNNLFTFVNSNIIDLELNQQTYTTNNNLVLDITTKKNGFVSIFYVGNSGQVGLIADNLSIDKTIKYPENGKIILKNNNKKDKVFMIAILYSESKINLQEFHKVEKREIKNINFIELLKYFDEYDYLTYSSQIFYK